MSVVGTLWRDAAQRCYVLIEHVTDERVYVRRVLSMPDVDAAGVNPRRRRRQRGRALFTAPPSWLLSEVTFDCAYAGGNVLETARLRLYADDADLRWPSANVMPMRLRRNLELRAFRPALAREREHCRLVLYVPEAVLAEELTIGWRLHVPAFLSLYECVPREACTALQRHVRSLYRDQGWRRLVTISRLEVTLDSRLVGVLDDDELTRTLRASLPSYCSYGASAYIEFSAERVSVLPPRRLGMMMLPQSFNLDGRNINFM